MRQVVAGALERLLWLAAPAAFALLASCRLQDDQVADRIQSPNGGNAGAANGGAQTVGGSTSAGRGGVNGSGGDQAGAANDCAPDRASISVLLADGTRGRRCSAWAARRSFAHAICSCGDMNVEGALVTDAFDSSQPGAGSGRGGAAVGVNGAYVGADYIRIDGSFTIAGSAPLDSPGGLDIAGDLRLAGATTAAGPILVSRDAWLQDKTSTLSIANIGRNLHLAPNAALHAFVPVVVGGDTIQDSAAYPPPCACGSGETLDIAGIVADTLADNDNAQIALQLDALADVAARTELALRCGRFALRRVSGRAPISLRVSGRVSLAIEGDALIPPGFALVLEPEAELDLFISGNLTLSPDTRIGDSERASAVRVYVLGSNEIVLPGTEQLGMNLYAPRARVTVEALGNVYGALFAGAVASRALLFARYDRAVLHADEACSLPASPSCTSCDQCSTTSTCVAQSCTACVKDADCCFPLACEQGRCQALIAN
jgi:hypothetical protein